MMNSFLKKGQNLLPATLKGRQKLYLVGALSAMSLLVFGFVFWSDAPPKIKKEAPKPQKISTPLESIKPEDRWVNRIEKKTNSTKNAYRQVERQAKLQGERLKALERVVQGFKTGKSLGHPDDLQEGASSPSLSRPPFEQGGLVQGSSVRGRSGVNRPPLQSTQKRSLDPYGGGTNLGSPQGAFIYQSSLSRLEPLQVAKNIDTYIPAGTHARGVLISGLTAYTGTNSISDPEPLKIRLTDYGIIAKGFKGDIKDAVIIGSCFGEISAERARCRIHTLTLEEENGEIIETPVQGWVMGEDGRGGIRGVVIDRAGEMARAAFGAGLLGGISSFFQKQAQSSVFPVSPFGQTNALKGEDLLKSAGTAGVGNALEKLADYAIKRAEKMEPVIVVDPGRRVDVLFKEGFDLSGTQVRQELHRIGSQTRQKQAKVQAQNLGAQTGGL